VKKDFDFYRKLSKDEFSKKMNEKKEIYTNIVESAQVGIEWSQLGMKNKTKKIIRW
jgi:hypothetical protein